MNDKYQLDSMSLAQLRKVAVKKNIPRASKLDKQELLQILLKLRQLESMSRTKLLTSLKEYGIKGIREMPEDHLVLIALQVDRFNQFKVSDLRTLVQKDDLVGVSRLNKKEIVKRLLDAYTEDLRSEPSRGNRRQLNQEPFSLLAFLPLKKWLGRAIQISSTIGIILSLLSMVLVPILVSQVSSWIDGKILAISNEATKAAGSIRQLSVTLDKGVHTLEAAEISMRRIENSLQNSEPLIDSTAELLGDLAPDIIDNTRDALLSAEESAHSVDQVLRNLARFGPLTGVTYAPDQPLDEAIAGVAESLEPLPAALRRAGVELSQTDSSLIEVRTSLNKVGDELGSFAEEISDKNILLMNVAEDLDRLSKESDKSRGMIKNFEWMGIIILEVLIIGHALGQMAILYVGFNLTQYSKKIPGD
jgi:hypothetical protein